MANDDDSHVLYRFIDRGGLLLYVGITKDPASRFRRHGRDQDWWDEVITIHLMHFGSRSQLLAAEREAIATEHPIYNRQLNYSNGRSFEEFDVVPCPVCRTESFWRHQAGRYFHLDGSRNHHCWAELASGRVVDDRLIDRHGHEIPEHVWRMSFS